MPLIKTNTGYIIRGNVNLNSRQRDDCHDVIALLKFEDLGRGAGTLREKGAARLDMQGRTTEGEANIQVQIGGNTVAAVLVANTVLTIADPINKTGACNGAISVLNQSMDAGTVFKLTGTLP